MILKYVGLEGDVASCTTSVKVEDVDSEASLELLDAFGVKRSSFEDSLADLVD